jgi:hypothetical protein
MGSVAVARSAPLTHPSAMRINLLGRARPIAVTLGALWLAGCVAHAILAQAAPTAACGIVAGCLLAVGMDWLARGLRGHPRGKGARL